MKKPFRRSLFVVLLLLACAAVNVAPAGVLLTPAAGASGRDGGNDGQVEHWVGTWAASQQLVEPHNMSRRVPAHGRDY